ncbi:TIGR00366 family protein, partial [Psychrobacter sp. SIMBA_152]
PSEKDSIYIDPSLLKNTLADKVTITRPAQHLEQSKLLGMGIGLLGLAYLGYYFFIADGGLNLNSVIALFLFLAITLHQT